MAIDSGMIPESSGACGAFGDTSLRGQTNPESSFLRSAKTILLAAFSVLICLASSSRQAEARNATETPASFEDKSHFRALRAKGNALYNDGKYLEAGVIYQKGYDAAAQERETASAIRFLNNLAGCRFALFDHRGALTHYLAAQKLAESIGDTEMFGTLAMNISSIRLTLGETSLAARGLEKGIASLRSSPEHVDQLLIQLGWIYAQSGDFDKAVPAFRKGLEEADRRGNSRLLAKGLDHLGYQYLVQGRLAEAETHLIAAYRLRLLARDPELGLSYPKLGMLRHKQGDLESASNLMDKAIETAARARNPWPTVGLYYRRALVRRDQGRIEGALADLRASLGWARRWRAGVLPSDSARTAVGVDVRRLYVDFVDTAAKEYFKNRSADLPGEMFEAAEEQRAASLRESLDTRGELSRHLRAEYPEKLAQLRSAEVSLLQRETAGAHTTVRTLRQDLSHMETEAGLSLLARKSQNIEPLSLRSIRQRLRASEALLSIHAGKQESYLWAITSEREAMYRLPGEDALRSAGSVFANAVSNSLQNIAMEAGEKLYRDLFALVEPFAASKPDWLVVLDTPLFEVPLAALVVERSAGKPIYLVQRHSIRLLPGAWVLLSEHGPASAGGSFLGIGDSVYNTADTRWPAQPPRFTGLENARLVGSGREIEACARAYGADRPVLLKGWDTSRARMVSALAERPEVLHIAAHVLRTPGPQPSALIHLGLRPSGEAETLNPSEIVLLPGSPDLVVLSGCASGAAPAVPGEGLMGLTRAWLISGAAAVAASYWPITDDDGELFLAFYKKLSEQRPVRAHSVASALRAAQLDMLRSNGWRSDPRYWAAFFVIGRS